MNTEKKICVQFEIPNSETGLPSSSENSEIIEKKTWIEPGSTIVQAAYQAGVVIQQTCGGTPSCTDCRIQVKSDLNSGLFEAEGPEIRLMGNVSHLTKERLACQAKIKDHVTIFVPKYERTKKQRTFQKGARLDTKSSVNKSLYGKSEKKENHQKTQNKKNIKKSHS
jgi:uncharacterized 2Fe-2S/4Fe-4S cluster protein (DUF4445 family)